MNPPPDFSDESNLGPFRDWAHHLVNGASAMLVQIDKLDQRIYNLEKSLALEKAEIAVLKYKNGVLGGVIGAVLMFALSKWVKVGP